MNNNKPIAKRCLTPCIVILSLAIIVPLSAQTQPLLPAFDKQDQLAAWLQKAQPSERLTLYQSYFARADFLAPIVETIKPYWVQDLRDNPRIRQNLAQSLVAALAKKISNTIALVPLLDSLSDYPESALVYYLNAPHRHLNLTSTNPLGLNTHREQVLVTISEQLSKTIDFEGRAFLISELMRWPLWIKDKNHDSASLRALQKKFLGSEIALLNLLPWTSRKLEDIYWKDFLEANPSEDEFSTLLMGLLASDKANLFNPFTKTSPVNDKLWQGLEPNLHSWAVSSNLRLKAISRIFLAKLPGNNRQASLQFPPLSQLSKTANDWEAYSIYYCASARGEKLSEQEFLSAIDSKRPSLAAAVLEDRYFFAYKDLIQNKQQSLPIDASENNPSRLAFEQKFLQACLELQNSNQIACLIPSIKTTVVVGGQTSIGSIAVLSTHPNGLVRRLVMEGLVRFAQGTMYSNFNQGLADEDTIIRILAVRGLGTIRDARALLALATILKNSREPIALRIAAAESLSQIGDRRMTQYLKELLLTPRSLNNDDYSLRLFAVNALAQFADKTAIAAIIANIDPSREDSLNYACLEALARLNVQQGYATLLPVLIKSFDLWLGNKFSEENELAAMRAIFNYDDQLVIVLSQKILNTQKEEFSELRYLAAWYLLRKQTNPSSLIADFVKLHRETFFASELRVIEYARLLDGQWDLQSLLFLSLRMRTYAPATQNWLISSMIKQASLDFVPALESLAKSPATSVRAWAAHLLNNCAELLSTTPSAVLQKTMSARLIAVYDGWQNEDRNSNAHAWLAKAARTLEAYRSQ